MAAAAACGLAAGCASREPAVESNFVETPGSDPWAGPRATRADPDAGPILGQANQVLDGAQRAEVMAALESVAAGQTVVDPPRAAPLGVRWTDVPLAVGRACGEAGVEMAIVRTDKEPGLYAFHLVTVEAWPAGMTVAATGDDRVYEITEAWVGRFPEQRDFVERRDRLVKAFEEALRKLGRQRVFDD